MANGKRNIIWAVDPFSRRTADFDKTAQLVRGVAESTKRPVELVYVMSPGSLNWHGDFSGAWAKRYKPLAQKSLDKLMSRLNWPQEPTTKIMVNSANSRREDTRKLLNYAKRNSAEMIVVNTHARKGISRLLMGSFAENLALDSKVPLLVINPRAHVPKKIRHVLFPTDLTPPSKRAMTSVIRLCRGLDAKLSVYHKIPDLLEPLIQSGVYVAGGGWISVDQYWQKEGKLRRAATMQMAKKGRAGKVKTQAVVEDREGDSATAILQYCESKKVDIIALTTQSSRKSALLLGSVSRQLIRSAPVPIWIRHG